MEQTLSLHTNILTHQTPKKLGLLKSKKQKLLSVLAILSGIWQLEESFGIKAEGFMLGSFWGTKKLTFPRGSVTK